MISADQSACYYPDCVPAIGKTVLYCLPVGVRPEGWYEGRIGSSVASPSTDWAASQSFLATGTFSSVTIQAFVGYYYWSADQTWSFYLTTNVGPSATNADLVASTTFVLQNANLGNIPDIFGGSSPTIPTTLFSGVAVTAGTTYFVTGYASGDTMSNVPYWFSAYESQIEGISTYDACPHFCGVDVNTATPWMTDFTSNEVLTTASMIVIADTATLVDCLKVNLCFNLIHTILQATAA